MRIFICLSLIFLYSCSQRQIIKRQSTGPTSTFSDIENSNDNNLLSPEEKRRMAVLEYYKKLREQDSKNGGRPKSSYNAPVKKAPVKKQEIKTVDTKDQFVEIEQHSIFYCMDKKTSGQFNTDDECKTYTDNLILKCQNEFDQGDSRLTSCVKSGLR
ncbi:hypothetical protein M899_0444 [Bacteriovorax sp. BSW11_IV]|uniref:hypothetical protein n=1 Tax=Bacteriovorax sp. BSW11_IV TaxID=1353529 RepID=UPI00038A5410|nr:hypothetical protein [Bacteriovorax sp. BSW11_IV]EQC45010.1 hypothetical protein M899_0444 [Bacteriovorax sp. BSW11_IV]